MLFLTLTVLTDARPTAASDNIRGGIRIYFTEQDMTDAHQKRLNQITSTENDNTLTEDHNQSGSKLQELLLTTNNDKQINSRHELYQNPTTLQFKFKTESPSSLRTVASPLLVQNSVRNKLGMRQRRAAGRKRGSRNHRGQQQHGGHQNIQIHGASWFKKYQALYNTKRTTYQPEEVTGPQIVQPRRQTNNSKQNNKQNLIQKQKQTFAQNPMANIQNDDYYYNYVYPLYQLHSRDSNPVYFQRDQNQLARVKPPYINPEAQRGNQLLFDPQRQPQQQLRGQQQQQSSPNYARNNLFTASQENRPSQGYELHQKFTGTEAYANTKMFPESQGFSSETVQHPSNQGILLRYMQSYPNLQGPTSQWLQRSPEKPDSQRATGSRTGQRSLLSNIAYTRPAVLGIFNKLGNTNARSGQLRDSILSPSPAQDYALHRIGLKDDASFMEASPNFDRNSWTLNAVQSLIPKAQAKDFIPRPQQKPLDKFVRVEKSKIPMVTKPGNPKVSQNVPQQDLVELSKKIAIPNARNRNLPQATQVKNVNPNTAKPSNGKNDMAIAKSNKMMMQAGQNSAAIKSNEPVVSNQRWENMELVTNEVRLEKGQRNANLVTNKPAISSRDQQNLRAQESEAVIQQENKNINPTKNETAESKQVDNNDRLDGGEAVSQRDQSKMAGNINNALVKHDTINGLNIIKNPVLATREKKPTTEFNEDTNYERSAIPRPNAKPSHEDNDIRLNFYKEMKKPPTHFDENEAENDKRDVIYRDINPSSEIDSDDVTAENLAAIFNELDGEIDSVLREDVSKKDLISRPKDDVARTQDEIEMTVYNDRNEDRSESNVNFVNVDSEKDSGVNFEQKQELTPIENEENVTGVTKTLPKEKFDLKRLHFGLRNGNTFD